MTTMVVMLFAVWLWLRFDSHYWFPHLRYTVYRRDRKLNSTVWQLVSHPHAKLTWLPFERAALNCPIILHLNYWFCWLAMWAVICLNCIGLDHRLLWLALQMMSLESVAAFEQTHFLVRESNFSFEKSLSLAFNQERKKNQNGIFRNSFTESRVTISHLTIKS